MLNQARLKVLKVREDHVRAVLEEARKRLGKVTQDQGRYAQILESLILQGLYQVSFLLHQRVKSNREIFQLFEPNITVKVRPQDRDLIKSVLPTVATKYRDVTGRDVNLTISDDSHLSQETTGGIELFARQNKIKVANTLEARLELISQQLIPQIRNALFGRNTNRKFTD